MLALMVGQRRAARQRQTALVIVSSRRGARTQPPPAPAAYDAFANATSDASTGRDGSLVQSFMLPAYRYKWL